MRIGLVVPHIFMQDDILPNVIFSPGELAIDLARNLKKQGQQVVFFTPGSVAPGVKNETADLSLFQKELDGRGDSYMDLLKKHPFTFITLARQVQSELIAKAFSMANDDRLDIVHIYTNEEDTALPFAKLCKKPVVFTHHDPFNFLVKYKSVFAKYPGHNWISLSMSQRKGMPKNTNWVGNIYHGLPINQYSSNYNGGENYIAYLGRIVEPKGLHLAISAVQQYNQKNHQKITLKIAGKHYADYKKDRYWREQILPLLKDPNIKYLGFLKTTDEKQEFLANATALVMPSIYEEPFGMVMIEALACATPIIGLEFGAIPEIINEKNGILVKKDSESKMIKDLSKAIDKVAAINRKYCREDFEVRFTSERMASDYLKVYEEVIRG